MDYLTAFPEVYVVSVRQLVEWVKNPVPVSRLSELEAFQCQDNLPTNTCPEANTRNCPFTAPLPIPGSEAFINICEGPCPTYYPYLDNVDGSIPY